MGKVRTRASREKDWQRYLDEFRRNFWGTSEMLTKSDSGKVTKNCYLVNILQSIDRNLKWIDEHPEVNKVVMLKVVVKRCKAIIDTLQTEPVQDEYVDAYVNEIRPELGTKSKIKKVKSDSRIATYLASKETTKS